MAKTSYLISWIGKTDHDAAEGKSPEVVGPIASALLGPQRYDRVYLLTNYEFSASQRYCAWLEDKTGYDPDAVDLYQVDLSSPIDYASIYDGVTRNLKQAGLPRDDVELTFHLSPGTSAMTAIWIILAKTRFPARLIQTSREHGLESVDFFFDLANDFLPEFLQRGGERITRLVDAARPAAPEFAKILHQSAAMRQQIEAARRIAVYDVPVLILGETGTGKELFAEAIHAASERAGKPYIAVNCGAIASDLAASELFGHVKGAFTGAAGDRTATYRRPTAARSFWTRSAICLSTHRCACCVHFRPRRSRHWALPGPSRWMCASSRPRTGIWPLMWRPGVSARTCSTAWRWASFICRPCGIGKVT
jgi:hypothetical protein